MWNNFLSNDFKDDRINLDDEINLDGRSIYGFLCFDNPINEYFHENNDVSAGYVVADIISLFFITRAKLLSKSKTYNDAIQYLNSQEKAPEPA